MDLDEMRQLYEKVKKRVKVEEDDVRFYWISQEAVTRVLALGSDRPQPPPDVYII
jgi:CRISPR-associated protein Cas2